MCGMERDAPTVAQGGAERARREMGVNLALYFKLSLLCCAGKGCLKSERQLMQCAGVLWCT